MLVLLQFALELSNGSHLPGEGRPVPHAKQERTMACVYDEPRPLLLRQLADVNNIIDKSHFGEQNNATTLRPTVTTKKRSARMPFPAQLRT